MTEKAVLDYECYMYNHEFHRISYVLDDLIRGVNKHWVNKVKIADADSHKLKYLEPKVDFFKKHDCQLAEM